MHAAHQPRQHRGIAHSGVKDAKGRRRRPQSTELLRGSFRDDGLFVAGIHEGQSSSVDCRRTGTAFGSLQSLQRLVRLACGPGARGGHIAPTFSLSPKGRKS